MTSIGERISELRKKYSYSQEYVADRVNVSRQAVSKWERDLAAPDTYNLIALAELFGVTVEYLAVGKTDVEVESVQLQPSPNGVSTQRLVGSVLLGTGLIALILSILFSEVLMILAILLLVAGILCLAVRKHLGLVMAWTYIVIVFLTSSVLTTNNLFAVFAPIFYVYGSLTIGMIISYLYWGVVAVTAVITILKVIRHFKD